MAGKGGEPFVCAGGTLVRTDRVAARTQAGNHLWYSRFAQGLRRQHAGPDRSHWLPGADRARGARLDPSSSPPPGPTPRRHCTGRPHRDCPPPGGQEPHRGRHRHQGPGREPRPGPRHQTARASRSPAYEPRPRQPTPYSSTSRPYDTPLPPPQPSPPSPPQPRPPSPSTKTPGEKTSVRGSTEWCTPRRAGRSTIWPHGSS